MNRQKLSITLVLSILLATGCGATAVPDSTHSHDQPAEAPVTTAGSAPTLQMSAQVSGDQATIKFTTTNFTISPNHYNGAHVPGEGHIHLFVDGNPQRIAVKGHTYVLTNLKPGTHTLDAQLHTNNHQPYNVKDEVTIMVK